MSRFVVIVTFCAIPLLTTAVGAHYGWSSFLSCTVSLLIIFCVYAPILAKLDGTSTSKTKPLDMFPWIE